MNGVIGKRILNLLPVILVGFLGIGIFMAFSKWVYDDPFITYRYARNLLNGFGFVYNPGERILSTTTPLFTLILALIGISIPDFHLLAVILGVASLVIGGLFIYDLGRTWNSPIVGWTGLLLYPTFPLLVSTLGSETPIYLAFCLGAFAFYARNKVIAAGILIASATLTRPDGILLLGILGFDYILQRKNSIPWKSLSVVIIILVSWIGFAWIYFGSPVPVTLFAKQQQGSMAISQTFARGLLTILRGYSTWFYIEVLLAIAGLVLVIWKKRQWWVILIWPIIYFASYSILGVSRYFWYYAPLVPGFVTAVGLGLTAIYEILKSTNRAGIRKYHLDIIVPSLMLLLFMFSNVSGLWRMRRQIDPRYSIYQAAGDWLNRNTEPGEIVGSLEVGIIGFFADRPMVDFAGLIQPGVAEQFNSETTYEDSAAWAVSNYKIDYLVLQDGLFRKLEEGYATEQCQVVHHLQGDQYSTDWDVSIFDCR